MKPNRQEFQDEKTGEIVCRVEVPSDIADKIKGRIIDHNKMSNQFGMLSQQETDIHIKKCKAYEDAVNKEKVLKETLIWSCKKMKLDPLEPWGFNPAMNVLEKRVPPRVEPMTNSPLPQPQM